ncbi:MAG: hypothetical protein ACTSQI_17575 [Candidatus Helarchaeota archaeon]
MDWGIIGTIIGIIGTLIGIMGSIYSYLKFKQIRKEELMTNIDIDLKHEQKTDGKNKFLWGSAIFKNIGLMNLMVDQLIIEFIPKVPDLKLDFNKIEYSDSNKSLKFEVNQTDQGKKADLTFMLVNSEFLKIDKEYPENMGPYFNMESIYFMLGLQIASAEVFSEEFVIPYEGAGVLEINTYIHSYKRVRRSVDELDEWKEYEDEEFIKHAEIEKRELEDIHNEGKLDRKVESFVIFLE